MTIFHAIEAKKLIYSLGKLANRTGNAGSVAQAVVDGDTLRVLLPGGQGIRFLGCDTPEKRIKFPVAAGGKASAGGFVQLDDPRWATFLAKPFDSEKWGPVKPALSKPLITYLTGRIEPDVAANHWRHATAATAALAKLVKEDRDARQLDDAKVNLFIAYSQDVLDRYGRPLGFLNIEEKVKDRRPALYNERMLTNGQASPYFIWPNIDPFRDMKVTDAAMPPAMLRRRTNGSPSLSAARKSSAQAREQGLGIYDPADPLQLQAFELRFLAGRRAPERWVIDLSAANDDASLYEPQRYFKIPNLEDRLFIPAEYAPLFREKGWKSAT